MLLIPFLVHAQDLVGEAPANSIEISSHHLTSIKGLSNLYTATGKYTISADGYGYVSYSTDKLGIEKPTDKAVVVKAYLLGASEGFSNYQFQKGDVIVDGNSVSWKTQIESGIGGYNAYADVTSLVQTMVSELNAGVHYFSYQEVVGSKIDGCALLVVFEDSTFPKKTISILWGALDTNGDTFTFSLAEPINPNDQEAVFDMGLGISYGSQLVSNPGQYSIISVNEEPLTSIAGSFDDGIENINGSLITVGGIGDSNDNPLFPDQVMLNELNFDDELYNLLPFLEDTDQSISIHSINPSNDDNLFLAYFEIVGEAQLKCRVDIVVENDPGNCGAIVESLPSKDNNHTQGSFFPVGTTITNLNDPNCIYDITVLDTEPPNAICKSIEIYANAFGDYEIDASMIDGGSYDNCSVASLSITQSIIPCNSGIKEHEVTLIVYDEAGNSSTCTSIVTILDDADCDGVGNACDICPNGDDSIDNDKDGLPDCAFDPRYVNIEPEWICSNKESDQKVYMCVKGKTICVEYELVQDYLDHGGFIGPCDNSSCLDAGIDQKEVATLETESEKPIFSIYPNPNNGHFTIQLNDEFSEGNISIVSYIGSKVYEQDIMVGQTTIEVQFDNFDLQSGMYYVIIQKGDSVETQKLILE